MTKWGPFLAPLTTARRGMSIGPFACIHIEGQSSQNGGSSPGLLRPNGHSGVRASKEAEHLWRSRSPQYFLPVPLALPRLTAIKSRKERGLGCENFPGSIPR